MDKRISVIHIGGELNATICCKDMDEFDLYEIFRIARALNSKFRRLFNGVL